LFAGCSFGAEQTVCDLLQGASASETRLVTLRDTLIISQSFAALGSDQCETQYRTRAGGSDSGPFMIWPAAVRLRPSARVPADQLRRFRAAGSRADQLRQEGKRVSASGRFSGRIQMGIAADLPGELLFDSVEEISVDALQDASELPVIPICDLFQNLPAWKGKRVAVRGEVSSTFEGAWLADSCKGGFITEGYRWPVSLVFAAPAWYSSTLAFALNPGAPEPRGADAFRGRHSTETATYVGRLQMREQYRAVCRPDDGLYVGNGFGHMNAAAAAIVVDEIRDVELSKPRSVERFEDPPCRPPEAESYCPGAALPIAVSLGCRDRVAELLEGGPATDNRIAPDVLGTAIRRGDLAMVGVLLQAGAPVNPASPSTFTPLEEAAW
jgi:hypothetical protein